MLTSQPLGDGLLLKRNICSEHSTVIPQCILRFSAKSTAPL